MKELLQNVFLIILLLSKAFKFSPSSGNSNNWECLKCNDKWSTGGNSCLNCNKNGNSNKPECINICQNHNYSGYYLDYNGLYRKCYESCKECNGPPDKDLLFGYILSHNCKICANGYYKLGESNCYSNETIKYKVSHYYLYNDSDNNLVWGECYKDCETCSKSGDSSDMNCLSCINNEWWEWYKPKLILRNGNCKEECRDNQYMTISGGCSDGCGDNFLFTYDHSCVDKCPDNYEPNDNKCVMKYVKETTPLDEFKSQVTENITDYLNITSLINGSDFIAVIYSKDKDDPKKQLEKGISAVDLGECADIIKNYYGIPLNDSLIILNMESKMNSNMKNIEIGEEKEENENKDKSINLDKISQIEVFDMSGRSLNISVCDKEITIMKLINDSLDESDIEFAKSLSNQGIDIFNPNDDFFNDLCHNYKNSDGKDIILKDRRNDFFKNVTFCQTGCTYAGMNYELNVANCVCSTSSVQGEKIIENYNKEEKSENVNFKSIAKSFVENLLDFNIDVIYCYNLVFDFQRLVKNIGFYTMFIMLILQIIFLIIFLIKKLKPIKEYIDTIL